MADGLFTGVVESLQQMGFFDVLLPFLLIFAIVYGILEKTKLFEERHDINATIAFVIGMIVIGTSWVLGVLSGFLPWVGLLSVLFVSFLLLIGLFWGKAEEFSKSNLLRWGGTAVVLIAFIFVLPPLLGFNIFGTGTFGGMTTADWGALIAIFIVFGLILYIAKPKEGGKKEG